MRDDTAGRSFGLNTPKRSSRAHWNIDFMQVDPQVRTRESSLRHVSIDDSWDIRAMTFARDQVLWVDLRGFGAVGTIDPDPLRIEDRFRCDGQLVSDLAYDGQELLLMLDAPNGRIWLWNSTQTLPSHPLKLGDQPFREIGTPLPEWARMCVWSPAHGPVEVVMTGGPEGSLLRLPLHGDGTARVLRLHGEPDLVAALAERPGGITVDAVRGEALIAVPSAHLVAAVDLSSGQVRCGLGTGAEGDTGDGLGPLEAQFMAPTDVVTFRYGLTVEPRILTLESNTRFKQAKQSGRDRCVLVADAAARRIRKWAQVDTDEAVLPLIGGGGQPLTGQPQQNLLQYDLPSPMRLALSHHGKLGILSAPVDKVQHLLVLTASSAAAATTVRDDDSEGDGE